MTGINVETVLGKFHPNSWGGVTLSEDRQTALGSNTVQYSVVFSNAPISNELKFSVKTLEQDPLNVDLHIGMTTKSPDSVLRQQWIDIETSDQYWYIGIRKSDCIARHNGQTRVLRWRLNYSPGNTFGCAVTNGDLHLYHNGRDLGVAWKKLPTRLSTPLWGFLEIGGLKVETTYIIAKGHMQDYAGKTFLFVEWPSEGLICTVCQALAHDPVQANCCGNIYCGQCIERWQTRSNSCPTCRSTKQSKRPFTVFEDRKTYRDVRSLSVYCPNTCGKKMDLSEVDNHLTSDNGCPDQVVNCRNKCGHSAWRGCVTKHVTSECRLRREKCRYCPLISTHEHVTRTHLKECPNYPLPCPNECYAEGLTRSSVHVHLKVCPLQQVQCEYKRFGCTVVLGRMSVAEHMKTSVQHHLRMIMRKVEEIDAQPKEEKAESQLMEALLKEVRVERELMETQLKEERAERQLMETQLKAEKAEHQLMETRLKEERAERQLMETRLKEVETTLARFMAIMD